MIGNPPLVVGIGEILWDRFPDGDRLGGAPANFAFQAGQLGAKAQVVARLGRDSDGDRILTELAREGVSLEFLQRDDFHPTGTVLVELREGQPTYTITQNVAWDFLEATPALMDLAAHVDAVCFGTLAQRSPTSRETIQQFVERCPERAIRLFDINLRQQFFDKPTLQFGLKMASVLKLNADEVQVLPKLLGWLDLDGAARDAIAARLLQQFDLELVAITLGAEGCELHTPHKVIRSKAPAVECVDAVGAGDAFSAALVMGLIKKSPLQHIADHANSVGAFVASQRGAMPPLPANLALALSPTSH
ncbi:MAG: carbohydrate kinase family protein [Planctomycetaceae bacterium]